MKELPTEKNKVTESLEESKNKTPKSIAVIKTQWLNFQNLTAKKASDSLFLIGFKLFLKAIMVLILILMSPFILVILMLSFFIAM